MFKKILIANRGEIAVRINRACRDLGISPVAVYSESDQQALHVKLADAAYPIGAGPSSESYLVIERLIETALQADCDAVHPGYGFLAENHDFAKACESAGLVFIGPSPHSIELMGDKIAARRKVQEVGVPVVPGAEQPVDAPESAARAARQIGFPVMVKASAGGGGKGMRVVHDEKSLLSTLSTARGEARSAFGDPTIYIERYLTRPRHIEVQILGDRHGNLIHLGERECSIQRRHQKLVEECPAPTVDETFREQITEAALTVARAVDYYNAGTVEFLVDSGAEGQLDAFYFLEMNTRLQVEHPVTELVTGIDLVREQIRIAAGELLSLSQREIRFQGAALECRIYAEDPLHHFSPSPGPVSTLIEPSGPGIRNDSGVYAGFQIPMYYDPLISKLIAYGCNRQEAIQRMRRALREYVVWEVQTTIPFFEILLTHPQFQSADLHTNFIEEHQLVESLLGELSKGQKIPLVATALDYWLRSQKGETPSRRRQTFWKDSGRPGPLSKW